MPSEYCGKQQSGICIWPLGRLRTTETAFGAEIKTVGRHSSIRDFLIKKFSVYSPIEPWHKITTRV